MASQEPVTSQIRLRDGQLSVGSCQWASCQWASYQCVSCWDTSNAELQHKASDDAHCAPEKLVEQRSEGSQREQHSESNAERATQ